MDYDEVGKPVSPESNYSGGDWRGEVNPARIPFWPVVGEGRSPTAAPRADFQSALQAADFLRQSNRW